MGLLRLFSHKRNTEKQVNQEEISYTEVKKEVKRSAKFSTQAEVISFITDQSDTIKDSGRQIEEAKTEYQLVTSYLTDMQKIDLIPLEQRGALDEAAEKIINLSKERGKLQNKSSILSDMQYSVLEQNEPQLPRELQNMKECEEYQNVIDQDILHLEKERKKLDNEEKEIIGRQSFLKGIAMAICTVIMFLFVLIAVLCGYSEVNYTLPFILTVVMGMLTAYYIVAEARKNLAAIQLVQMKQNRQIALMNKVKIKSVNNQNYLDYAYNKFMVDKYEQLQILWNEYVRVKEEARRYQKNSDELEQYNNELISELKEFGIADAEIWIFQPTAIIDRKEMVEVRHRLNVRRQKLRERIDLGFRQKEESLKEINKTMKMYPDCVLEVEKLLRRYQIDL